ncbi:hypothetical protein ACQE3E_06765 [Methylomonas sp. MED-D]|uniref:hypothetical protein n=1 Tax=Methylomonas sp. MED-D TaxID=3418768 RepID=UPI003D007159
MDKDLSTSKKTAIACILWFALCAVAFSNAGFNIFFLIALPIAGIWWMVWFVRLMIYRSRQYQAKNKNISTKYTWIYWALEPATLIVSLVLSNFGVFSYIRFMASEQALTNYAEHVRAGKVDLAFEFQHPPRQVGLYTVTVTDLLADGTVRMITSSHSVMDKAGFANSPNNPPLKLGEDSYKHIYGRWWYWYESW